MSIANIVFNKGGSSKFNMHGIMPFLETGFQIKNFIKLCKNQAGYYANRILI